MWTWDGRRRRGPGLRAPHAPGLWTSVGLSHVDSGQDPPWIRVKETERPETAETAGVDREGRIKNGRSITIVKSHRTHSILSSAPVYLCHQTPTRSLLCRCDPMDSRDPRDGDAWTTELHSPQVRHRRHNVRATCVHAHSTPTHTRTHLEQRSDATIRNAGAYRHAPH